ncbi:MAG: methylenetetrahydrofolate reductase [Deltaproteobacteria bacterium]|nr:methylenetetrahydrofolate reductase [Deltaproteobacteria bacterium]
MALLGILSTKAARGEVVFTAEISPPRLYLEIDRIVGIARRLRALGLDAIAVTNSTGSSYKFSPWAIVEDVQRAMAHVPLIIHLTARDEGSARSVYYHLHEMSLKGVRDVLIIRGDPSAGNSKLLDSYRFTTFDLVEMVDGYRRGTLVDGSVSEPLANLDVLVAAHPEFPEKGRRRGGRTHLQHRHRHGCILPLSRRRTRRRHRAADSAVAAAARSRLALTRDYTSASSRLCGEIFCQIRASST